MGYSFAKTVSGLFHPLLMPTYSVLLLFQLDTYINHTIPVNYQNLIIGLVFINTFVLPLVFVLILMRKKFITSIYMQDKKERIIPFVLAFFFYGFTYYLLKQVNLPQAIYSLLVGASLAVLISLAINFATKLSIHMVGIAGVIGGFYALALVMELNLTVVLLGLVLLSGLVGTSRLRMNQHTPKELLLGFVVGFFAEYAAVLFRVG